MREELEAVTVQVESIDRRLGRLEEHYSQMSLRDAFACAALAAGKTPGQAYTLADQMLIARKGPPPKKPRAKKGGAK